MDADCNAFGAHYDKHTCISMQVTCRSRIPPIIHPSCLITRIYAGLAGVQDLTTVCLIPQRTNHTIHIPAGVFPTVLGFSHQNQ